MKGNIKICRIILAIVMTIGSIVALPTIVEATSQQTAVDWVKAQANGRVEYDVDGIYGNQCSDFGTAYINYLIDGNAWSGRYTTYNGYQYFDISYPAGWQKIVNYDAFIPQPGDILVFNGTNLNPNGHVCVAIEGCTTTVYKAVGQDGSKSTEGAAYQSGAYFDSYIQFRGAIRPSFDAPVTPPTTSNIQISRTSAPVGTSVTFTFSSNGATGYTIGIDKGATRIDTHECYSSTSYTRSFSEPGSYSAYVTSFNSAGHLDSSKVYFTIVGPPNIPANLSAVSAGYNSNKITWTAATGATGYEIYRSTSSSSGFAKIVTTSSTSYTDTGLTTGTMYYYKIRAYTTVDITTVFSGYTAIVSAAPIPINVSYQTHVQDIGWQDWVSNGASAGTSGQALRLEAIRIKLENVAGGIEYCTHVQDYGWMNWVSNGALSGTSGESKRLEAIKIRLTGTAADQFDVYYRVHAQNFGWLDWAKNGEAAGTAGYGYRLEAIQIVLIPKRGSAPGATAKAFVDYNTIPRVLYQTHVQDYGWQAWVSNGATAGTSGESKRLEAINIKLQNLVGNIEYRTHVQDYGWMNWVVNGALSGTSGESKRLEAIEIRLSGEVANQYDVYYRVHAQNFGWLDWAKNGQSAGTAGFGYRLEAIQIVLVPKGGAAPGATARPFVQE